MQRFAHTYSVLCLVAATAAKVTAVPSHRQAVISEMLLNLTALICEDIIWCSEHDLKSSLGNWSSVLWY